MSGELPLVLIESDWNLKILDAKEWIEEMKVLIESDWNLKLPEASFLISSTNPY